LRIATDFVPAVEEAVRAICAEPSWLLPAHDRSLENYRGKTVEIDLNSAATSWNLALTYYWLGDKLSPDTRDLIRRELERRTFAPFEGYAKRGQPKLWWATARTIGMRSAWPASQVRRWR